MASNLQSYRELIIWKKAIELVKMIYQISEEFPKHEIYTLSSQIRRAAISIPSNIAEGYTRRGLPEYLQFLNIAKGSAAELETQLVITKELYPRIDINAAEVMVMEIQKMLFAMMRSLRFGSTLNPKP